MTFETFSIRIRKYFAVERTGSWVAALDKNGYIIGQLLKHGRRLVVKKMHHDQPQTALVLDDILRNFGKHLEVAVFGKENDLHGVNGEE